MMSVCCFGRPRTGPKAPVQEFEGPAKPPTRAPVQKDLILPPDQGVHDQGVHAATLEPQLLKLEPLNNASVDVSTIIATGDGAKQDEQTGATLRSLLSSCDYLGTPQGSVALGSTRPETDDNCGLASDSVRTFSWADVGELTYLGQGATGVVYRAESAAGAQVAVKFMICNTPQQLWQRAKEALLSKLVTHPNLVRTLAMDVTLVTPNTYREWGVSHQRSTAPLAAQQGSGEAGPDTNTSRSSGGVPTSELPEAVKVQSGGQEYVSASGRLGVPAPVAEAPAGQEAGLGQRGRGPVNGLVAPCDQGSDVARGDTNRGEFPGDAHSHLGSKQHSKDHLTTGSSRSGAGAGVGLTEQSCLTPAGSRGHAPLPAAAPGAPTSRALASVIAAEHSGPGIHAGRAAETHVRCNVTTELHPRAAVLRQKLQQHLHHLHEQQAAPGSCTCLPHHDQRQEHLLPDAEHGGGMQAAAELPGASVDSHTVLRTWASSASPQGTHSSGVSASSVSAHAQAGAGALQQPTQLDGAVQRQLQPGEQAQQQGVALDGFSSMPLRTVTAAAAVAGSTLGMIGERNPDAPSYPLSSPAASSLGPNSNLSYSLANASSMYGTGTGDAGHALGWRSLDAQVTRAPEICVADTQGAAGPEAVVQGPGDSSTDAGELTLAGSAATGGSGSGVGNGEVVPIQDILYHLDALPGRFLAKVIMEYCDGGTLLQRINAGEFLAAPERGVRGMLGAMQALLLCLQEVAAGMAHLHNLNIIHGKWCWSGGKAGFQELGKLTVWEVCGQRAVASWQPDLWAGVGWMLLAGCCTRSQQ